MHVYWTTGCCASAATDVDNNVIPSDTHRRGPRIFPTKIANCMDILTKTWDPTLKSGLSRLAKIRSDSSGSRHCCVSCKTINVVSEVSGRSRKCASVAHISKYAACKSIYHCLSSYRCASIFFRLLPIVQSLRQGRHLRGEGGGGNCPPRPKQKSNVHCKTTHVATFLQDVFHAIVMSK